MLELVLIGTGLPVIFLMLLVFWVLELSFYYQIDWDFSKSSNRPKALPRYSRDIPTSKANRHSLLFGYPFFLIVVGFFNYKLFYSFFM
jgi:hypothetical protein